MPHLADVAGTPIRGEAPVETTVAPSGRRSIAITASCCRRSVSAASVRSDRRPQTDGGAISSGCPLRSIWAAWLCPNSNGTSERPCRQRGLHAACTGIGHRLNSLSCGDAALPAAGTARRCPWPNSSAVASARVQLLVFPPQPRAKTADFTRGCRLWLPKRR
jgi:hypothetical protein